jgi:tight adherence protein B
MKILLLLPVLIGFVWVWVARNERRQQFVRQRLTSMTADTGDSEPEPLSLVRKVKQTPTALFEFSHNLATRLDSEFEAAGRKIGVLHLLIAGLISAILVIVFTSRILGIASLVTPLSVAAAIAGPFLVVRFAQSSYRRKFLAIFPDSLDLIRRAVKAGLPVNEALAVASQEIADPVGSELRQTLDHVKIGVHIIDALNQMADRIRVPDFRFLVVALALQQQTGGSLAETLANLSGVLRARKALREKAKSLSAEAKASAAVLALLPFVVGGLMYLMNRDLAQSLIIDPRGRFMVGIAFLSLVTGLSTMVWIVRRALR